MSHARLRRRLTDVPFATLIGLVGVNGAVTFLVQPDRSVPHALLSPYDYAWALLYGMGGLLILAGILTGRANVEAAGCVAFAGGAAVSAVATAALLGAGAWNSVLVLTLFVVAALIRTRHLAQGRVLVLVRDAGDSLLVRDR